MTPLPAKPRVFLPALVSGVGLWFAYFPYDLGPVAFIALAPLITLVRAEPVNRWRRYLAAYLGGLAFFGLSLNWIRVAHPMMAMAWIGLSLLCAGYWPLALLLIRRLDRWKQPSLALTVPIVWTAVEYIRAHFPTGFPLLAWVHLYQPVGFGWYYLGHAVHSILPLIQIADVTGVFGISFAVASVNGALAEWLMRIPFTRVWLLGWDRQPPRPGLTREFWATAIGLTGIGILLCYGSYRLVHAPFERGPRVAAIQADIPQNEKTTDQVLVFQTYDRLCRNAGSRADLVIWPETCFPAGWYGLRDGGTEANASKDWLDAANTVPRRVQQLATGNDGWRSNVLLGTNTYDWNGTKEVRGNSAVLIDREGQFAGRYDKIHLVPFGEYVPFKETLPFLKYFTPYGDQEYSCTPGTAFTRFPLTVADRQYTFGVVICYEDSDPTMCRPYVRPTKDGEPVDFLVNISNDGWFLGTAQHEQHLAVCRFRAIETRRSIVRAVNMGISGFIDPDGRVTALPGDTWAGSKRMEGIVSDYVPVSSRGSFYAWAGDWFAVLCWLVIVLAIALRKKILGA